MEITLKISSLSVKRHGSINLLCTAQTASDELNQSSLLTLNESSQLCKGEKWPIFTYKFTKQYLQIYLTFLISQLINGNQEDIGAGHCPLVLSSKSTPPNKIALLKLKMKSAPLYINVGNIQFQYSCSVGPKSGQDGGEETNGTSQFWIVLSSARQSLPLLNDAELVNNFSEVEETSIFLKMKEKEQKHFNGVLLPETDPILNVVFHSFATSWNTDKFTAFACLIKGDMPNNMTSPRAEWFWNEIDKPGSLSAGSIMKIIDFKLKSPLFQGVGMYLFAEDICGPILHVTEPIYSLAPFRFYHRGWLPNIPQPTVPSDSCVHDSVHVLTSIHLLPSAEDYEAYNGFELIVTDVSYPDLSADTTIVLGVELIRKTTQSEINFESPKKGFIPSFFEKKGSDNAGGSNNFKMSICRSNDSPDNNCKAYFFFPENEMIIKGDIQNRETPMLIFHVCVIDGSTSLPWWVTSHHYEVPLEIDFGSFQLLTHEDIKGVRWFHSWEGMAADDIRPCTLEIALRWKDASTTFLTPTDCQEMSQQQYLSVLLHHFMLRKNQQYVAHDVAENAFADMMQLHQEDMDGYPNPMATASSKVTFSNVQLPMNEATSVFSIEERTYRQTIQELGTVLLKVQQEKEVLEREKASLVSEVVSLKSLLNEHQSRGPLRRQDNSEHEKVDMISRITVLEKELSDEKKKGNTYLQTIRTLENKLETQKYKLDKEQVANHKQVKGLCRKVHKYKRCYETALQQDQILTQLEMLISQLPPPSDNHQARPQQNREGEELNQRSHSPQSIAASSFNCSISQSSISFNGDIFDEITDPHQLQQAFTAMSSEIARLRHENGRMHSHLTAIIKTLNKQKNTRRQSPSPVRRDGVVRGQGDRIEEQNGSNDEEPTIRQQQQQNEPLISF